MKRFKRGEKGFTLVELLIVVAILGILAAVVIPNVVGLMGRGGAQAYETDQEVIQLATSTFYSDVHAGWDDVADDGAADYTDNVWGANDSDEDSGHYYPTAIAGVSGHVLRLHDTDVDPDQVNNELLVSADGVTAATTAQVSDHAIWMGLLVTAPGEGTDIGVGGTPSRGTTVSALLGETGLYLQEMPESAMSDTIAVGDDRNGAPAPGGGYLWVVGKNGTVYGVYSVLDPVGYAAGTYWFSGFSGAYP